jgi:hypothetical protein
MVRRVSETGYSDVEPDFFQDDLNEAGSAENEGDDLQRGNLLRRKSNTGSGDKNN